MLDSIHSRILAACIIIVAGSLAINTFLNYSVANKYNNSAIDNTLTALTVSHSVSIAEWVASKTQMIMSLKDSALTADPLAALKQVAAAGGFINVYIGYADKTAIFSNPDGIPADYDPTGRPWYLQAVNAGKPVVTPPYIDAGTQQLVVTFAWSIVQDGVLKGVIAADVTMGSVIANVNAIHPTDNSFGMLIGADGTIIAHPETLLTLKPLADIAPNLNLQTLLTATVPVSTDISGSSKLLLAQAVPGTQWFTVVALDKSQATAGIHSLLTTSLVTLVIIIFISAGVIALITQRALTPLTHIQQAMDAISSGSADLTQRLPIEGRDEVAQIARSFNQFADKLSLVMAQIRGTSESVRVAANEIAAGNQDLSGRTESAAASLQQTSAALEQISATVAQSASAARQANNAVFSASEDASRGGDVITKVITTMESIEKASGKIGDITSVIDGIAFQTNILALNAAVEAARAGEQGRGFAVVAGEVRILAQRSAQAAKEIKALIESTVSSVASGSSQVRQASNAMTDIVSSVSDVTTIMSEITNAADEQMRGIHEINSAVAQLDTMVQQNAALVQESTAASAALQAQAADLTDTVNQFKI
ncbi:MULTISPECIES: methyl-accepting chemotaxis protein [Yersinia pseudotuberculosis complex]|uniref:Methyl-accepting chemotaxis protein n=1 Tax=Yersinia pseudotuberculosis serotype O:1b (strain IP 31758) TaxID=349747 RepID=A0A0U1R088_YERP3|nr:MULTISPECIES: methyl-accepting chemotaxis protein [Yersinia pseudotuberculosis complex]ABS48512.1 methyl-accepting chemotaxis protein [Yersinia pseudotuberculosis IP 31758]AJJ71847.1 methyl-accepting chemotaxis (MCP) signaling domain protein [Yersinia pseudotuberculosis]AJK16708.1 methyl-accepting chemotaxis (MCP) signaling domain protein [Yersinia pseudotuberculosis str. PA3606]MBO1548447.1 HAMP domain-containing protein [Yersinia pseudotuberculosis]MBO1568637.1 HAMP domain-containing prot